MKMVIIYEGYPGLTLVGAEEKMRDLLKLSIKLFREHGITLTFYLPIVGIKLTRKLKVFQKKGDGYQGDIDDLVIFLLNVSLFAFHDLGGSVGD